MSLLRALVLAFGTVATAHAQTLADPMRPPVTAVPAATARELPAAAPQVQTIIIGPTQRYAVIDGRTLAQGDRFGAARIERITETEVTLRQPDGKASILGLLPQVQKKAAGAAAPLSRAPLGTNR